jgi:hypothetical protein
MLFLQANARRPFRKDLLREQLTQDFPEGSKKSFQKHSHEAKARVVTR